MSDIRTSDLLYPIAAERDVVVAQLTHKTFDLSNPFFQTFVAEQSSSAVQSSSAWFDRKFAVPYEASYSSVYQSIARQMRIVLENQYSEIAEQKYPGIWKTQTPTATDLAVTERAHVFGISNYYYGDEIANGSFKLYYRPNVSSQTGTLSALQTQSVLRFVDINTNNLGPSFAVSGTTGLRQNLSSSVTGFTVEMLVRPVGQMKQGYFFHRWTTNSSSSIIDSYQRSTTSSMSAYPFYSAYPYYGVGAYFNKLSPIYDQTTEQPFIELCVYGALSSVTSHPINLSSNTVFAQTRTRYYLDRDTLDLIFDGGFHAFRFSWATTTNLKHGRVFVDNKELTASLSGGDGRDTAVSYALSGTRQAVSPIYFMSRCDDTSAINSRGPSKNTFFGEAKHFLVFDNGSTGSAVTHSATSNDHLWTLLGASTANLKCWFGFSQSPTGSMSAVDLTQTYTSSSASLTGFVSTDQADPTLSEGRIDRVLGLLHDIRGSFAPSKLDSVTGDFYSQRPVGRLYHSEYGSSSSTAHVGYIFYDRGSVFVLNDAYNAGYSSSTQAFVSTTGGTFSFVDGGTWRLFYSSFMAQNYHARKIISVSADADYFCKSTNRSSLFRGTDDKTYTRSNRKIITGIVFFGRDGIALAETKFSTPIQKPENVGIKIDVNIDM